MSNTIYHIHHIIPKHLGGTDEPSNLIKLTIEEHAEAHRILYEQLGHWQDKLAWQGLTGLIGKDKLLQEMYKNRKRPVITEEHKQILRERMTNRVVSEETRKKLSDYWKGKPNPKMKSINQEKRHCIVCNKTMNPGNFKRYHRDCEITGKPTPSSLKGKPSNLSEENRKAFSERMKNRNKTPAQRQAVADSNRRRTKQEHSNTLPKEKIPSNSLNP